MRRYFISSRHPKTRSPRSSGSTCASRDRAPSTSPASTYHSAMSSRAAMRSSTPPCCGASSSAAQCWSSASCPAPRLRSTQPAKFTARPAKRGTWRRSTSAVYRANAASASAGAPASACACPVNRSECRVAEVCSTPTCPRAAGRSSDSASPTLLWWVLSTPSQAAVLTRSVPSASENASPSSSSAWARSPAAWRVRPPTVRQRARVAVSVAASAPSCANWAACANCRPK